MADLDVALEGVEQPIDIVLVQVVGRQNVMPQDHLGDLQQILTGEADLVTKSEQFASAGGDPTITGHDGVPYAFRMARPSSAGVVPDVYGEVDTSWKRGALCIGEQGCHCHMGRAWTIMPHENFGIGGSVYKGEELIGLALQICSRCPVQWDCALYALRTEQRWGTWAIHITDLLWLEQLALAEAEAMIEGSREAGEPVQVEISRLRQSHLLDSSA